MDISLSSHFTYKKLFRFVVPSVIMMIFTSIYNVVDGIYISNLVGKTQFAALNMIYPYVMIFAAIGFMVGTGGTALISKTIGEGDHKKANDIFSMLVCFMLIIGIICGLIGYFSLRKVAVFLGATGDMVDYCVNYARILMPAVVFFMLQGAFQALMVAADKPRLGMWITILSGIINIVLDALLIGVFHLELEGAAAATAISQVFGGIVPIIYFLRKNDSLLRLGKPVWDFKSLVRTCTNGASEFVTNVSVSVVEMLYNYQLMRLIGENGVAAFGVISYLMFIFIAAFLGYSVGVAPVIGFNYGAQREEELQNVFRKSLVIIGVTCLLMFLTGFIFAKPLADIFVSSDIELEALTIRALRFCSLAYIIIGFNIFGSAFFTALNNGGVSATISFLRTLVFQVITILILPIFMGTDGVWISQFISEVMALCVIVFFTVKMNKRYHYMSEKAISV